MSPSQKYKKPVIGTITAQLSGEVEQLGHKRKIEFPSDTFEVIDIINVKNGEKVYVCNQWYKDGVPQYVPDCLVTNFTKKSE